MRTKAALTTVAVIFIILAVIFWLTSCAPKPRAILPTNGSAADVQAKINVANDGDTITIPAGTFPWDAQVNISKCVTIQGQTTVDTKAHTSNDATKLVDKVPRVSGGQAFFVFNVNSGNSTPRITGIDFTGDGGTQNNTMYNGLAFRINGTKPVRIDHCVIENLNGNPISQCNAANFGVMDHVWLRRVTTNTGLMHCYMAGYGGKHLGDGSFEEAANWGSEKFFFVEDCYISGTTYYGGMDVSQGGRLVYRHNEIDNGQVGSHGTARNGNGNRGSRAMEIYENLFHMDVNHSPQGCDGGSLLIWGNRYDRAALNTGIILNYYRTGYTYGAPFQGADGTMAWDRNEGSVYDSGTVTGFGGGVLTDSSKNWPADKWRNYVVKRASDHTLAIIKGNGSNTLNVVGTQSLMTFNVNDRYEIRKVLQCIDQPGLGKGDAINRNGAPVWLNQVSEPCYQWDNLDVVKGQPIKFQNGGGGYTIVTGRDAIDGKLDNYTPYTYPHPLTGVGPQPTSTPAPSPTATATVPVPTPPVTATPTATATAIPPTATPAPTASPAPSPAQFISWASGQRDKGNRYVYVNWSGSTADGFDVYRNGQKIATVFRVTTYTDDLGKGGNETFAYKVCEIGTQICTNTSSVDGF